MYDEALFSHILAVSNRTLSKRPFLEQIEEICKHHPKSLILREKDLSEAEYTALAKDVLAICQRHNVPCILHTYFRAAKELGCDAIHLPLPLLRAHKEELSGFSHVGTSIHAPAEAKEAEKLGATYITAGHIYATDCKKGLPPRGLVFLEEVCRKVSIPVYAIGGIKINDKQLQEVMDCGAKGGCIMSGMMQL